jgi:hypothetical protein
MHCFVTACKHVNNTQAIARQLLGKRVPMATVMNATGEVLLDSDYGNCVFLCGSCQNVISRVSRVLE